MTDNTQELDEILGNLDHYNSVYEPSLAMEVYPELRAAKQAILDWHKKQVEVIIEATYNNLPSLDKLTVGNAMSDGYDQGVEAFRDAIQAERNKLKERDDE